MQRYRDTEITEIPEILGIQGYRDPRVQGYRDTEIQPGIQSYRYKRIQRYRKIGIQIYFDTWIL